MFMSRLIIILKMIYKTSFPKLSYHLNIIAISSTNRHNIPIFTSHTTSAAIPVCATDVHKVVANDSLCEIKKFPRGFGNKIVKIIKIIRISKNAMAILLIIMLTTPH